MTPVLIPACSAEPGDAMHGAPCQDLPLITPRARCKDLYGTSDSRVVPPLRVRAATPGVSSPRGNDGWLLGTAPYALDLTRVKNSSWKIFLTGGENHAPGRSIRDGASTPWTQLAVPTTRR